MAEQGQKATSEINAYRWARIGDRRGSTFDEPTGSTPTTLDEIAEEVRSERHRPPQPAFETADSWRRWKAANLPAWRSPSLLLVDVDAPEGGRLRKLPQRITDHAAGWWRSPSGAGHHVAFLADGLTEGDWKATHAHVVAASGLSAWAAKQAGKCSDRSDANGILFLSSDPGARVVDDPRVWAAVEPAQPAPVLTGTSGVRERLVRGDDTIEDLEEMLKHVNPDCGYGEWRDVLFAAEHKFGQAAKDTMRTWSMGAPKRYDERAFSTAWNSAGGGEGVTFASLVAAARAGGYNRPAHTEPANTAAELVDDELPAADVVPARFDPLTADDWARLVAAVPRLEQFRRRAVELQTSPTFSLIAACATVAQRLHPATRIAPYAQGAPPQPATLYAALLGSPSAGKSKAMRVAGHQEFRNDDEVEADDHDHEGGWRCSYPGEHVQRIANPASGQALASALIRTVPPRPAFDDDDPEGAAAESLAKTGYFSISQAPALTVVCDEAEGLDSTLAREHGAGLAAALKSAYFGDAAQLSQSAATTEAHRSVDPRTPLSVSVLVGCQPGTGDRILRDETGLSDRFIVCAGSRLEFFDDFADDLVGAAGLFDDWEPPMITARGLVGGAPLIRLSSAARHELATAARVETTNADERSEMIDELKRLGRWLDDDRGGWWLEYGGRPHVVALVARIAAGLALIAEEPKIRRAHIDGARVVVEHDQRTRSEYRAWLGQKHHSESIAAARRGAVVADKAGDTAADLASKRIDRLAALVARKVSRADRGELLRWEAGRAIAGRDRRRMKEDGEAVADVIDRAVEMGLLVEADGDCLRVPDEV